MRFSFGWKGLGACVIVGAVAWSMFTVLNREATKVTDDTIELRFSHCVLDPGFREAMAQLCTEYEARQAAHGRKVRVTPLEIPYNVYTQWSRTQLIGRTAPEIMMINFELSRDGELIARYFRSLGEEVDLPNPYNAGSIHEGVRWRDSFVDGMRISGYIFALADHYGIPISVTTQRMMANRRLLERILADPANAELAAQIGPELVPRTFDQFIAVCDAARSWAEREGVPLIPIAANKESGRAILDNSVGSQNQMLMLDWPVLKDAKVAETTFLDRLCRGQPLWDAPAFRQGLEVLREIGLRTQPGFMQLRQEDSNFAFATERALMIYGSSMGASSLRAMTAGTIDFVVFPLPLPEVGHPRFSRYSMGPISEADIGGGNPFGIVNYTSPEKQELALDFLEFLSSFDANRTFTRVSGQVPVIAGVEPGPLAAPFALHLDGYKLGPSLYLGINDVRNLFDTYLYLVVSPRGSVDQFLAEAPPAAIARALANLRTACNGNFKTSSREDPLIASYYWLKTFDPEAGSDIDRRLSLRIDANDGNECDAAMRLPRLEWYVDGQK